MNHALRNLPLDFTHWEKYSDKEPYHMHRTHPVSGLRQVCYRLTLPQGVVSAGVFTLHGAPTHIAWGMQDEPHCSFHKIFRPDGTWSEPIEGCADVAGILGLAAASCGNTPAQ